MTKRIWCIHFSTNTQNYKKNRSKLMREFRHFYVELNSLAWAWLRGRVKVVRTRNNGCLCALGTEIFGWTLEDFFGPRCLAGTERKRSFKPFIHPDTEILDRNFCTTVAGWHRSKNANFEPWGSYTRRHLRWFWDPVVEVFFTNNCVCIAMILNIR